MTTYIILPLLVLMFPSKSYFQCRFNKTEQCLIDEVSWRRRSVEFRCQVGNYSCLYYQNSRSFVETCFTTTYRIPPNTTGCPYITSCNEITGGPVLIDPKYHRSCLRVAGCPPMIHPGYSILEMYKYPACITTEEERTSFITLETTGSSQITEDSDSSIPLIVGLCVSLVALFLICVAFFMCWCRKRRIKKELNETEEPFLENYQSKINNASVIDMQERTLNGHASEGCGDMTLSEYVRPSAAFNYSVEILNKHGILTLIGIAGSGKTTLAKDLMKFIEQTKSFLPRTITRTEEWEDSLKSDSQEVILIEDIFGKINLDQQKLEIWSSHLDSMISKTSSKKKIIILTSRKNVKKDTDKECIGIAYDKLFKADLTVNLSDKDYCMSYDEMKSLLTVHSEHNPSRKLSEQDCDKIIQTHYHDIGFPQLATLFFSSSKFNEEGVTFFQKGDSALNREIRNFDSQEKLEFSVLSFMSINEDRRRSDSNEGCVSLDIEKDISDFLTFHDKLYKYNVNLIEVRECLIEMKNTFVRESKPKTFCFHHETVYGTVLKAFGENHPSLFLEMMNGRDIWKYGRPRSLGHGNFSDLEVRFERQFYGQLASKLISFTKGDYGRLLQHKSSEDKEFVPFLLDAIEIDVSKLTNETVSKRSYEFILSLYNGECDILISSCILRLIQGKLFYKVGLNRCLTRILKGENTFKISINIILAYDIPHLSNKSMLQELIMNCSVEFIMECAVDHTELLTRPCLKGGAEKGALFLCVDRAIESPEWEPLGLVQHLLSMKGSTLLIERDPKGCSPTAYALKKSCFSLLDIFLDYRPNIADDENFTFSLQRCIKVKNTGLVRKIIFGRPKAVDERDNNNFRHPLLVAADENDKAVFGIIWKACHSSVNLDELVLDMMESIIKNGWDDYLAEIIEKNKDFKNCRSRREETPLILSAKHKQLTCMSVLLEKEADIYITDKNQRSFIHYLDAPDGELLEKVFTFVKEHPGIVFVQDKNGLSPLLQAVFSKRRNIAKRLFEIAKSDKERLIQDIRRKDKYDRTMLRETISNGWIDITKDIVEIDPEVVRFEDIDILRYVKENVFGEKKDDLVQIIKTVMGM